MNDNTEMSMAVDHTRIAQMEKTLEDAREQMEKTREDARQQLWEEMANTVRAGTPESDAELLALSPQSLKGAALHWLTRDKRVGEDLLKKLLMVRVKDPEVTNAQPTSSSGIFYKILITTFNMQTAWVRCPFIVVSRVRRIVDVGSQPTMYGPTAQKLVTKCIATFYYLHAGDLRIRSRDNDYEIGDEGVIMVNINNPERQKEMWRVAV